MGSSFSGSFFRASSLGFFPFTFSLLGVVGSGAVVSARSFSMMLSLFEIASCVAFASAWVVIEGEGEGVFWATDVPTEDALGNRTSDTGADGIEDVCWFAVNETLPLPLLPPKMKSCPNCERSIAFRGAWAESILEMLKMAVGTGSGVERSGRAEGLVSVPTKGTALLLSPKLKS